MRYIALGLALVVGMWWADTARVGHAANSRRVTAAEQAGNADRGCGVIEWAPQGAGKRIDYLNVVNYPNDPASILGRRIGLPGHPWTEPITGMEFVWVPGGCFQMGNDRIFRGSETPEHEVCVDGFWLGTYEVTQAEWTRVMGNNPSRFKGDRNPVEHVSWDDTQKFIRRLNGKGNGAFRLPTEAEWEYAARSGGKVETNFSVNIFSGWSEDWDRMAWYESNSGEQTHPVGGKAPNGLGLYDMSGNVEEWCQDWAEMGYYRHSPRNNPSGPSSGSEHVFRGGSIFSVTSELSVTARDLSRYSVGSGFRLVRTN
ncbi:MAG: formylglycine-generating enzyme family protein [Desulfovibrionaceae bacterium]